MAFQVAFESYIREINFAVFPYLLYFLSIFFSENDRTDLIYYYYVTLRTMTSEKF